MKTIKASEFKARCLQLMDEVSETGEPLVITKNGKPVSQLVPYRRRPSTLFGALKGQGECVLSHFHHKLNQLNEILDIPA
jgi:prevent-host-death family protein